MATQAERSASTRAVVVTAATQLFAQDGYEATPMDAIARAAGVSKGALYHHFADKRALMVSVYEDLERQVVVRLVRAVGTQADPIEAIRLGCHEFLRLCRDETFRRVMLVEAPLALGWSEWRAIDARFGLGLLRSGVEAAVNTGRLPSLDVTATSQVLLAGLMEAALLLGSSDSPRRTLNEVTRVYDTLLDGLVSTASGHLRDSQL